MMEQKQLYTAGPVLPGERFVVLDALRGLALLGICLANFPEFALYSFLPDTAREVMPTASADRITQALLAVFVDGKFYTLFSLLFGVGFSIILGNALRKGADGLRVFRRRMLTLVVIGFLHLILLWSGDILMLYALLGLFLPLFSRASDRTLLTVAAILLVLPVAVDAVVEAGDLHPAALFYDLQWHFCARYGITEDNFAYWLRDADSYLGVLQFLVQGAFERMQEFINGNRYFRVMGLFLIGFYIGRRRLFADLGQWKPLLLKVARLGLGIGLPLSLLYAWSSIEGKPWGLTVHSVLYLVSVFPMGFAYAALFCLCYLRLPQGRLFGWLAAPGRMALTCYIGQSVIGILLFYGVGLGWGASLGLSQVMIVAFLVFVAEALFCHLWLRYFRFGPLEWIWRMLTYGKTFPLKKETNK